MLYWHTPEREKRLPRTLRSRDRTFLLSSLFALTLATRIPFAGKFLYHFDSINFALALDEYNILAHQPHPPGYFLYIMLGRFMNLFIEDANKVFIVIGIVFSGLTVVLIYLLGEEIFDFRSGLLAAIIAMTSPNLWFHGEVALSYIVEAFFSTLIAFSCWKIIRGEENYLWASVLALGLSGGVRQNTPVFLFPLWLYSIRKVPFIKKCVSLLLLGLVSVLWFVPMILMTGGWSNYYSALRELWMFNTGGNSVFSNGWPALKLYFTTLFTFLIYGIGAWIYVLVLSGYAKIRNRSFVTCEKEKLMFFFTWAVPSFLFYLFIFIHPGNPGYALIFLPPLILVIPTALKNMVDYTKNTRSQYIYYAVACSLTVINMAYFLFAESPVSYRNITRHDRDLHTVLANVGTFDPLGTVLFSQDFLFYGFRHMMYYLPEYKTFMVDRGSDNKMKSRDIFCGVHGKTIRSKSIFLDNNDREFAVLLINDPGTEEQIGSGDGDIRVKQLTPSISVASGPMRFLKRIYPGLKEKIKVPTREAP